MASLMPGLAILVSTGARMDDEDDDYADEAAELDDDPGDVEFQDDGAGAEEVPTVDEECDL